MAMGPSAEEFTAGAELVTWLQEIHLVACTPYTLAAAIVHAELLLGSTELSSAPEVMGGGSLISIGARAWLPHAPAPAAWAIS